MWGIERKNMEINEQKLKQMSNIKKCINLYIMGMPEGEEKGEEKIFK